MAKIRGIETKSQKLRKKGERAVAVGTITGGALITDTIREDLKKDPFRGKKGKAKTDAFFKELEAFNKTAKTKNPKIPFSDEVNKLTEKRFRQDFLKTYSKEIKSGKIKLLPTKGDISKVKTSEITKKYVNALKKNPKSILKVALAAGSLALIGYGIKKIKESEEMAATEKTAAFGAIATGLTTTAAIAVGKYGPKVEKEVKKAVVKSKIKKAIKSDAAKVAVGVGGLAGGLALTKFAKSEKNKAIKSGKAVQLKTPVGNIFLGKKPGFLTGKAAIAAARKGKGQWVTISGRKVFIRAKK
jgi:hypothetical protein